MPSYDAVECDIDITYDPVDRQWMLVIRAPRYVTHALERGLRVTSWGPGGDGTRSSVSFKTLPDVPGNPGVPIEGGRPADPPKEG
jgi:hypothetical protein